ncbi:AI-2E family transporter [Halomicrobium urmianum]|uniref:AI-2E family transporter n=1 Tax=Halomicrobium urmianum TaxID=1586233 RepID=UPI001CD942EF|nr:AI-2E family transporter [Halomicrobium urmianum]
MRSRQRVLAGLVVATGLATAILLWGVVSTVFFAITVAYVLYPLRRRLVDRGFGRRTAAAASTSVAFLAVAVLIVPPLWSLYRRRRALLSYLRSLPDSVSVELFGTPVSVELGTVVAFLRRSLADLAVAAAGETPVLGLKLFLFALLVYAVLLRPSAAPAVVFRTVPEPYHDVVRQLHVRVRDTLYAIYVLQGATALGTFAIALVVFWALGYEAAFGLAVVAGILQFVPVIGPSVLVALVAATDLVAGDVTGAVTVAVLGFVFVGFLPDAVIRPQLAPHTADIPASLYFVGFTGGVLSVGLVGFIAGPLVVALFVETVDLLVADRSTAETRPG